MTASVTVTPGAVNRLLNDSIRGLFRDAVRVTLPHPGTALHLWRMLRRQKAAARTRQAWQVKGLQVPSSLILSVTHRCNLRCKGCYSRPQRHTPDAELSEVRLCGVLDQAQETASCSMGKPPPGLPGRGTSSP